MPWTCTRRPRTSSSTSAETAFHGAIGDRGGGPPRRGRGPRIIGAWVGVVALIAGAAILGGRPESPSDAADPAAGAATSPPPGRPVATAEASAAPPIIVLVQPSTDRTRVTTHDVEIRGYLTSGTGPVLAVLETAEGDWLAGRSVGPMTLGRPDDDPSPRFAVTLALPDPRPLGPLTVRVIAFDLGGDPQAVVSRSIVVGERVRREIGDDGLMGGGLPFGTPAP